MSATSSNPVQSSQPRADLVRRLRLGEPLPACPFDRISPLYLTMPDDKPCPFCGQENTTEGPDKCRGADTRIFGEAADRIDALEAALREVGLAADGPMSYSRSYLANKVAEIARTAILGEARSEQERGK